MKRMLFLVLGISLAMSAGLFALPQADAAAATCAPTGYAGLTAALIDPSGTVTGEVDATGCNIGVYFGPGSTGMVDGAEIHGANYFGVVARSDGGGNTNVDVRDSSIHNIGEVPFNGSQHGVGIYYRSCDGGHATGVVDGNTVFLYQKGGIVANCAGTKVVITDNIVNGLDEVDFIAQNGIQFGYGATGQVKRNTVDSNWYDGANWSSTGILIFESSDVVVIKNSVIDSQVGIGIESWCYFDVAGADRNQVANNSITGSQWGVSIAAYDLAPYTGCDATADGNKVVNNVMTGINEPDSIGVSIWAGDYPDGSGTYAPQAAGNKVIANKISGFAEGVEVEASTSTKQHANVIT